MSDPVETQIIEIINGANSVRGALFRVKNAFEFLGGCEIAYEYLLWPWSHIRGDLMNATTISPQIEALYYPSGGTNTDPIIDQVARETGRILVNMAEVLADEGSKYYGNPFFKTLHQGGCVSLATWSISGNGMIGHGAFTVFEDNAQKDARPEDSVMMPFTKSLHHALHRSRLLGAHFGITEKEAVTLEAVAAGRTADDIAEREGITTRSVELRLQGLRKKMRARNSSEAVYKAVAHGILPPDRFK